MALFIDNLTNYIMLEVIESQWTLFQTKLDSAQDLDSIIAHHHQFLNNVLDRALLTPISNELFKIINQLYEQILRFIFQMDQFYTHLVPLSKKRQEKRQAQAYFKRMRASEEEQMELEFNGEMP